MLLVEVVHEHHVRFSELSVGRESSENSKGVVVIVQDPHGIFHRVDLGLSLTSATKGDYQLTLFQASFLLMLAISTLRAER